jgi:probable HAF family extracellular repeat protein
MLWQDGVRERLPLPHGLSYGWAYDVNDAGVVAGSAGGPGYDYGVCTLSDGTKTTVIRQTLPDGSYCSTAFAINGAGRVVGSGIDPNNPARNVAFVIDTATNTTYTLGGTPGRNGAIAFGVSEAGQVVGASMQDQGDGVPFIWTESTGMVQLPLPKGTSSGEARGVNSAGWVVGYASSAYSIPFVYDGSHTYRLANLLPSGSGWDLSKNTSSAAMSISENGVIIGTGERDGQVRAFAMIPRTKG